MIILSISLLALVCLASIGALVVQSIRMGRETQRGWLAAHSVERELRTLCYARINTLENRVLSKNSEEYAGLQNVPSELDKAAWAGLQQAEANHMWNGEPVRETVPFSDAEDLEGDNFEGPTVG